MALVEQQDDWLYTAHATSTPAEAFGEFAGAVALWRAKAPADGLPRKRSFQALDFRDWFGGVIIYEVIGPPFDLKVRLFGTDFVDGLRTEITGKSLREASRHVPGHEVALRYFAHLADRRLIGVSAGPLSWEKLDMHSGIFMELPVADDTGAVRYFFTFGRLGGEQVGETVPLMREARAALRVDDGADTAASPSAPVAANDTQLPQIWRRWL